FGESLDTLRDAIRETNPDLVLCLGQAGGRPGEGTSYEAGGG
ncbi:pyroglutamyl-peptidase I family protein, partial [Streptomyces sp. NPDC002586]